MTLSAKIATAAAVCASAVLLAPRPAAAGLIYDNSVLLSAQGFGNAPRDLTVQRTGSVTSPESGCISAAGGVLSGGSGACLGVDAAMLPNGVVNAGGDEVTPLSDNQKFGIPFESDRGITTAQDIGILFNATEPGGDGVNIIDLTLKFYLNGLLIGSIDGQQNFADTNPGNGVAGFVFRVDQVQLAYVNGLLSQGNIQFALESTMTGTAGGPESFRIVNLNADGIATRTTIPEPASLLLCGLAALTVARRAGRRV
jgi:hypothetical protein